MDSAALEKAIRWRRIINPALKVLSPLFMKAEQVMEDRNALLGHPGRDSGINLPPEPVAWIANHAFKDDVAASIRAGERAYADRARKAERDVFGKGSSKGMDGQAEGQKREGMGRKNLLQRLAMPQKELEAYYRALRAEDFRQGKIVGGLGWRRKCHPFVMALLWCSSVLAGQRLTIIGDRREALEGPAIYACTHVGRYDIEMALRIIGRQCWFFMGDPGKVYKNPDGLALWMNGTIFTDTAYREDRHIGKESCVSALEQGASLLIYPEGAWNITENQVVQPLFTGAAEMSLRTGAKIVPIAIEQYGKQYYANIGRAIDPEGFRKAACKMGQGMPDREEKQALTDHLRDVLCTLKWEIWEQFAPVARDSLPEDAADVYLDSIMRQSENGYTVEEIVRTRFHPKQTSPEEAFAFRQNLKPCRENAFLLRG